VIRYDPVQRARMIKQVKGQTIVNMEYSEGDGGSYWVITLSDGSEFAFRLMAELV